MVYKVMPLWLLMEEAHEVPKDTTVYIDIFFLYDDQLECSLYGDQLNSFLPVWWTIECLFIWWTITDNY